MSIQMTSHPAWAGDITASEAAKKLERQLPFTYILRREKETRQYFISFVDQEGKVEHESINLEEKGWFHRNGWGTAPLPTIDLLIQEIMRHVKNAYLI
jgi:hypothetical protein